MTTLNKIIEAHTPKTVLPVNDLFKKRFSPKIIEKPLRYVVSGYLVENDKVLLTLHSKQNKWVPSGGHIEENELPQEALKREYQEELGIDIEIIDAIGDNPFADRGIWEKQPRPFYADFEEMTKMGYDHDIYLQFYYVKRVNKSQKIQDLDVKDSKWFTVQELEKLEELDTYEQVKALGIYSIKNFPK